MAHFRGTVATKRSGLTVEAQSWEGKVVVSLRYDEKRGCDMATVELDRHHGAGTRELIFHGPVSGQKLTL
jgi:hypothetical protein